MQADQLASDLTAAIAPDTQVLSSSPVGTSCGTAPVPVVRVVLRDPVLFATDSDQPRPDGGMVLDQLAARIRQDTPGWQLTVLGHTDAIGSDAYNLDLSRRRAARVLRALADRGIDPSRLSAVAIGRRQPVASNSTPEGRALNRRVEFLVSRCLSANLGLIQQTGGAGGTAEILRLDPAFHLASAGTVSLGSAAASFSAAQPTPATAPASVSRPAATARPRPAPRYQPNTLSPEVQPAPLGPAVPY